MKIKHFVLAAFLLTLGCATYKQLKPEPELSFLEQGYIELKKGKEDFALDKGKRYFITFPAPQDDRYFLVLNLPDKRKFGSYLTSSFLSKMKPGKKIADESPVPASQSVYAISRGSAEYFWIIDYVPADVVLRMQYRYVPQWRFTFEVKHAAFTEIFKKNIVDRGMYKSIGLGARLENFNFPLVLDTVAKHTAELQKTYQDLLASQSLFPANILNSGDEAYKNYASLKKNLEEEIEFQTVYHMALDFFYKESQSRNSPVEFLARVEDFISYFSHKSRFPENILKESKNVLQKRLDEIAPFYDQRLMIKEDAEALDTNYFRLNSLNRLGTLYEKAGIAAPPEILALVEFITDFESKRKALLAIKDSLSQIANYIKAQPGMPSDDLFRGVVARASALQNMVPPAMDAAYGKYQSFACATALNQNIAEGGRSLTEQVARYQEAQGLVLRLNLLKNSREYSAMLGLLRQNTHLAFLIDKYKELDKMSLDEQGKNIRAVLESAAWDQAEARLRKLNDDVNFINVTEMLPLKQKAVLELEDSLYTRIERVSRNHINQFLEEKVNVLENVDSLYTDSVFLPVYNVTFSSGGHAELLQRKNTLVSDLARTKEYEFPAKAIKLLYEQFTKNPDDNGVLKARAIVTHGAHYQGTDKEILLRVTECNPNLAKAVTKPKDFRRVFVLPVTDNRERGKNKYIMRFNINIPTEAKFPVYDVTIKLPKEVAQNASAEQWYSEMTLNRKVLKNEGRFSITAPNAANDYECQISPVQVNKDQGNILEVVFNYPAFKVFNASVMVQKPIIKKN